MKALWNSRYKSDEFVYGKAPNQFFKDSLNRFNLSGNILFPAEGEGRNAVYAAQQGLSVYAFDISTRARDKALKLAKDNNVQIRYEVGEITDLAFEGLTFDSAALIFSHLPPHLRPGFHQEIARRMKPGGIVILEGFSKNNLPLRQANPNIGGPNKIEMLFSEEEIKNEFGDFDIIELQEVEVELQEGNLHNGIAKVIRFLAKRLETANFSTKEICSISLSSH